MLSFQEATPPKQDQLEEFIDHQTKQLNDLLRQAHQKLNEANNLDLSPKVESERPWLIQSIQVTYDCKRN